MTPLLLNFVLMVTFNQMNVIQSLPLVRCPKYQAPHCQYNCKIIDCAYYRKDTNPKLKDGLITWKQCMEGFNKKSEKGIVYYYKGHSVNKTCETDASAWTCICVYPKFAYQYSPFQPDKTSFTCSSETTCLYKDFEKDRPVCHIHKQERICFKKYNCGEMKCTSYRNDMNKQSALDWLKCNEAFGFYYTQDQLYTYIRFKEDFCSVKVSKCMCIKPYILNDLDSVYVREYGTCIDKDTCYSLDITEQPKPTFENKINLTGVSIPECDRNEENLYCNYECGDILDCKTYYTNLGKQFVVEYDKCMSQYKSIKIQDKEVYYKNKEELVSCLYNNGTNKKIKWSECRCGGGHNLLCNDYWKEFNILICCYKGHFNCNKYAPSTTETPTSLDPDAKYPGSLLITDLDVDHYPYDFIESLDPNDPSWQKPMPLVDDYHDELDLLRTPLNPAP